MRLLLDTHVLIWSFSEPERLGAKARRALANQDNQIFFSPLSVWEMVRAQEKGRLALGANPEARMVRMLKDAQVTEASFTFEIAIRATGIALPHRDPIDRLLAATASHYDLALVTSDSQVLKGKGFESLRADR